MQKWGLHKKAYQFLILNFFPVFFQTGRMLDEEEREDTELRDRFKDKWNRQPSGKLTESLRKEVKINNYYH